MVWMCCALIVWSLFVSAQWELGNDDCGELGVGPRWCSGHAICQLMSSTAQQNREGEHKSFD